MGPIGIAPVNWLEFIMPEHCPRWAERECPVNGEPKRLAVVLAGKLACGCPLEVIRGGRSEVISVAYCEECGKLW
jgi:hypothetical protein